MHLVVVTTVLITMAGGATAVSAAAQTAPQRPRAAADAGSGRSIAACPSQRDLEQVLGSGGRYMPDACRRLAVTPVETSGQRLCVLDFKSGAEPGLLDRLADATIPTQWWVDCRDLDVR